MDLEIYNKKRKILLLLLVYQSYLTFLTLCYKSQKKKNRISTRFSYSVNEKQLHGFFNKLSFIIKTKDSDKFRKATRMGISEFRLLKQLIEKRIRKQNFIRQSISPECRLAITLVYLGHGVSRQMLAMCFGLGVSTVGKIILETCDAIWSELEGIYLAPPNKAEWFTIADEFYEKTAMPNVVGAIDGRHIEIKCPLKSGSDHFNFSIVLLAACDSNFTFTALDIGTYGSQNDGGILKAKGFGNQVMKETINTPKSKPLPNSKVEFPFYFLGDIAFPLKRNIMRPYPGRVLTPDEANFNKKLARARTSIENTFGILTAKWRVLSNSLNLLPENAEKILKAAVVLHNFVKFHDGANYCPTWYVDHFSDTDELIKGTWRHEVSPLRQSKLFTRFNATKTAFALRDYLKDYLYINNK